MPDLRELYQEVFDPAWHPGLMSDAAKLQLGFDLDYGTTQVPRHRSIEKESDRPHLSQRTLSRRRARNIRPHGHEVVASLFAPA